MADAPTPDAIADERAILRATRAQFGKRVGHDCDEWACDKTVEDGPLWRVNPKGRPGIFMCIEHRRDVSDSAGGLQ